MQEQQYTSGKQRRNISDLPHDLLAEKSFLGCLLIDNSAFDHVNDLKVEAVDFYHPKYQMVYEALYSLYLESTPIDYVSACSRLKDFGTLEKIGGQSFVLQIIEDQATSINSRTYAKTIKEKAMLRKLIRTASGVVEKGMNYSGVVNDFVSDVEADFFKITSQTKGAGLRELKSFLKINLKELEDNDRKQGEISGLPTGFIDLDKALLGLQPGQMVIIAARPGMGKTSLALNFAVNAAKQVSLPVAFFSLEMLAPELSMKILSSEAGVDSKRLKTKNFLDSDLRNLGRAVQELSHLPLFVNDSADINLLTIKSQCRKIKTEKGLGLVIIDYLQLMQSVNKSMPREQQISEISRGLKNLARELECPIIALSQLNRAVEARPDKRPLISDLRESGSIEQDADIVLMVYRDEIYNPDSKDAGTAEIIVAKNRAGERGTVRLAWIGSQTKFAPLTMSNEPQ